MLNTPLIVNIWKNSVQVIAMGVPQLQPPVPPLAGKTHDSPSASRTILVPPEIDRIAMPQPTLGT
jgi:hypothetical protein